MNTIHKNMKTIIIKIYLGCKSIIITILSTIVLGIPALLSAFFDRTGRIPYRIGQVWARVILRLNGVQVIAEGLDNINGKTSYVFISNHQSNLDGLVIGTTLPSPLRFVIKKSLLRIPIMGQAFKLGRMIPIDRSDGKRSIDIINRSIRELTNGVSALFFGEGSRSRDGMLQPFKKGGFMFALQTGLPLVPITVINSYSLMPAGTLHVKKGTIKIIIGPAIPTGDYGIEQAGLLMDRVRTIMKENLNMNDTGTA